MPGLGYEGEAASLCGNPLQFLGLRVQELKSSSAQGLRNAVWRVKESVLAKVLAEIQGSFFPSNAA